MLGFGRRKRSNVSSGARRSTRQVRVLEPGAEASSAGDAPPSASGDLVLGSFVDEGLDSLVADAVALVAPAEAVPERRSSVSPAGVASEPRAPAPLSPELPPFDVPLGAAPLTSVPPLFGPRPSSKPS